MPLWSAEDDAAEKGVFRPNSSSRTNGLLAEFPVFFRLTAHIESPPVTVEFPRAMSDDLLMEDEEASRLDALERFGFERGAMEAFLIEHEGGISERLSWLEARRDTASEIEDRMVALVRLLERHAETLEPFKAFLDDPFAIEEVYVEFEKVMRRLAPWEPVLNRTRTMWYTAEHGETWALLYRRLAALDDSSLASAAPLHQLFDQPERYDEIFRHLETIEADERRQRELVQERCRDLSEHGYDVQHLLQRPLLEALAGIDGWQAFHSRKEGVRLAISQLLRPFDPSLATEFERRCNAVSQRADETHLEELMVEVQTVATALEERRRELSDTIQQWRNEGIVFPHSGELRPSELMEWETNVEMVAESVSQHLEWVRLWERFAKYWPSRTEVSRQFIGSLEHTEQLRDAVEELDALWKKAELDGLDLLQTYEHAGLDVAEWRQQVFEDPLNALERIAHLQPAWDRAVKLLAAFDTLDTSFSGEDEIVLRKEVLLSQASSLDVLDEMEAFIARFQRRSERHRVMLEEELATMRREGTLERETVLEGMNLKQLEEHVARMFRGRQPPSQTNEFRLADGPKAALKEELLNLKERGWLVAEWLRLLEEDVPALARAMSEARPSFEQHETLRRRLLHLPWNRDVALAAQVELEVKQAHRLAALSQRIPDMATHLASRPIEDPDFSITLWQPTALRPTLVPVPESQQRPVLQPSSPIDDAHDAMLEAMEESLEESVESSPVAVPTPVVETETQPSISPQKTKTNAKALPEAPGQEEVVPAEVPKVAIVTEQANEAKPSDENDDTGEALRALSEFLALIGLSAMAQRVEQSGLDALGEVRRALAQHVNIAPRDVRVARLLRLVLRLLPDGGEDDLQRASLLIELNRLVPPLKRWMRRRLEARHSGASGDFLSDAEALGVALERIPGLGRRVPLGKDTWSLPHNIGALNDEVALLAKAVQLPSAGGVQA